MKLQKWIYRVSLFTAAFCFAVPAMAQGGKGAYIKAKPFVDKKPVIVETAFVGDRLAFIDRSAEFYLTIQANAGKNRVFHKKTFVRVGDLSLTGAVSDNLTLADIKPDPGDYTGIIRFKTSEAFGAGKIERECNNRLNFAADKQNKSRKTLLANGWHTSYKMKLPIEVKRNADNPWTGFIETLPRRTTVELSAVTVKCGSGQSKPNSEAGIQQPILALPDRNASKISGSMTLKGKKILQNALAANTDKIAAKPAADLYPVSGGFSDENQMDWILVTGNQGNAASKATKISIYLETTSDKVAVGKLPLPALNPGQSQQLVVNSLLPVSSIKTLYAHIDRPNIISERDEKNNQLYFKTADNADQRLILARKRPGRKTYGGIQANEMTGSSDEHEIEYDVASGAFKFKLKTSAGNWQDKP